MDNKLAIKVGLLAGIVSAAFPSIPTIVNFGYHKERWFQIYVIVSIVVIALLFILL